MKTFTETAQITTLVPAVEVASKQGVRQFVEEEFGMRQVKEARRRLFREAGLYAAAHPEESFASIGKRFDMSQGWVSCAARSVGLQPRKRGRKPVAGTSTRWP